MKTAEEWYDENDATGRNSVVDIIKQIQLDAMREGMRRAANKTFKREIKFGLRPSPDDNLQAILTAAEQLTEKDL